MRIDELFFVPPFYTPETSTPVKETLNPIIWDENQGMHQEVREKLLRISKAFIASLKLSGGIKVLDVIVTGSNCNFNYNSSSDLDLHLVVDLNSLAQSGLRNPELAKRFLNTAKNQWNQRRNITFKGIPVEVYVEDENTPPSTGGIFSVRRNRWLVRPSRFITKRRDSAVARLASQWAKQIDLAIKSSDIEQMKRTLFRIRDARGAALDLHHGAPSGETTVENLAFKLIRRKGYIDRLNKAMDEFTDRQFSIESVDPLNEFFFPPGVTYHKQLHPALWENEHLKPEVREKLIEIAKAFKQFIGQDFKVLDIRFKGSMANYNYTKNSDIDVHLIAKVTPEMQEFIEAKRIAWKEKYKNINVFGFPVELGVDDPKKIHTSSAVYSLMFDRWVDKPMYKKPETNRRRADQLYRQWKQELNVAIRSGDIREIRKVEKKIRGIRDKALPGHRNPDRRRQMELSDENVAYKRLRDTGVFDKVKEIYNRDRTTQLSLEAQKSLLSRLLSFTSV